jgi:hypothetical protein
MIILKKAGATTLICRSPKYESQVQQGKVNNTSSIIQDEFRIIRMHFGLPTILAIYLTQNLSNHE